MASSADLVKVRANLAEIGLPFESFDTVINGLDIERKKPAPDIFLLAAERLGLQPADCLVVEDAVNGVESGKNAGMKVLGIMSSFSEKELAKADYLAMDLCCVPPEALE